MTKLGYLIDNPWSNALDRARSAGSVLADVLIHRYLGVRPITLIGFSLGSRVIFYALLELAKQKAFGIVQDVFILGTTVTAPTKTWLQARSAVSGRFVNGYARNDWVLNYLFRATSGGLNTVAGLRPVENVPGLENVDVTDKIAGHMSYRTFMPLILDQLGFPVSADFFDEPVVSVVQPILTMLQSDGVYADAKEPDFEGDRIVVREEEEPKKRGWFSRKKKSSTPTPQTPRPSTSTSSSSHRRQGSSQSTLHDDLPPREDQLSTRTSGTPPPGTPALDQPSTELTENDSTSPGTPALPKHAGFNFNAIKEVIGKADLNPEELQIPAPSRFQVPAIPPPTQRSESAPLPTPRALGMRSQQSSNTVSERAVAGSSSPPPDLASSLSRSMSLKDIRGDAEMQDSLTSAGEQTPSISQPFRDPPSVSLGSNDNGWPVEPDPMPTSLATANSFSSSLQHQSTYDLLRPSGTRSYGLSSLPDNPFGATDSSGLSFGSADGSITFTPLSSTGSEPSDPWSIPAPSYGGFSSRKPTSSFNVNSNPWQS